MSIAALSRAPRHDNRRQSLLDAAARLFREHGFHATSMRDLASAVGMLSGSIYYHFPSKEEVLLAVYEEGVRRIADHVDAAVVRERNPWDRLAAACAAHLEMLLDGGDYAQVVIRVLPRDGGAVAPRLIALRDEYEGRFTDVIEQLRLPAEVDRRYLRLLLLGGLNWSQVWYRPGGDSPKVIAGRFLDIVRRRLDADARRKSP